MLGNIGGFFSGLSAVGNFFRKDHAQKKLELAQREVEVLERLAKGVENANDSLKKIADNGAQLNELLKTALEIAKIALVCTPVIAFGCVLFTTGIGNVEKGTELGSMIVLVCLVAKWRFEDNREVAGLISRQSF